MSTDASDGRHTARKNAARDLHDRTGMPYAAALRYVARAENPWQPRHRWIVTFPVKSTCRTFAARYRQAAKPGWDHSHTGLSAQMGFFSARVVA